MEKEIHCGKVLKLKCKLCCKYESRITSIKGFSCSWIERTDSVKKDRLMKRVNGDPHKYVIELQRKETVVVGSYNQEILENSPIGRGLTKMTDQDHDLLKTRFNTTYYLSKSERPYSDFEELLQLQEKNGASGGQVLKNEMIEDLLRAKYYSGLMDGSTDSSVTEQELIYILHLSKNGTPEVKFFSIESVIEEAFEHIGILSFETRLHGLNVDGASVDTGIHRGLGARIREHALWLTVVHCFNYRFELAVKDTFKGTSFEEIDIMLLKLYYLYQKSAKCTRELDAF